MKITITFLFILCLSSFAFGQKRKAASPRISNVKAVKSFKIIKADIAADKSGKDCWTNYDKLVDKTFVFCRLDQTLTAFFQFNSDKLAKSVDEFYFRIENPVGQNAFPNYPKLQFVLGDDRIELQNRSYEFSVSDENRKELLFFPIARLSVQKIAAADLTKIDYFIGAREGYFSQTERDKLRLLASLATAY